MSSGFRLETILKLHDDKRSFTRSNAHASDDQRNSLSLIQEFPVFKGISGVVSLWKITLMRLKYNFLNFLLIYHERFMNTASSI